jgi:hypothetical protein
VRPKHGEEAKVAKQVGRIFGGLARNKEVPVPEREKAHFAFPTPFCISQVIENKAAKNSLLKM